MPQSKKTLLPVMHAGSIQRLAVAGLLAGTAAACSSDTLRFGDNPFANPFSQASTADTTTTGSLGFSPTVPVQSTPLAPPQVSSQPVQAATRSATQAASGAVEAIGGTAKGWSAQGGSSVYVGTADTLSTLSGRYNVPTAAILAANGLTSASQIAPGQKLTIPVYNPGGSPLPSATAAAGSAASAVAASSSSARQAVTQTATQTATHATSQVANRATNQVTNHAVAPVQRAAASASQAVAKPVQRAEATAGSLNDQAAKLTRPNAPVAPPARQVVASLPPVTATDASPAAAAQKAAAAVAPAAAKPAATKPAATNPVAAAEPRQPEPAKAEAAAEKSGSGFRWPARGRVINGFGSGNEGINIAVPEGTPVKAAENGVVAYAGSELKGYGNLVLIRHENGWVSAYANNGELKVKRGETVSRGQTIAKSGQTGNVTSPQLHFELRKGSNPVDPVPHLAGL